jgi:hypothetical protein
MLKSMMPTADRAATGARGRDSNRLRDFTKGQRTSARKFKLAAVCAFCAETEY